MLLFIVTLDSHNRTVLILSQVKVDSDDGNIIEGVFPGLTALYFRHSIKLSIQYCIGQLVGDDENPHKSLGTVIPLSSLESICRNSLTIKAVLVRISVMSNLMLIALSGFCAFFLFCVC